MDPRHEPTEEALIRAIDDALRDAPNGLHRFIELERERRWRCSYRQARDLYSKMVSPDDPHAFDARALPNVIRVVGDAAFLDVLLGLEQRVARQRRADRAELGERYGPRRVGRDGDASDLPLPPRRRSA